MRFQDIIGQEEIKQKLLQTVKNGRISHAQLFLGKSGFGGLPLAIAYAQFISCKNRSETDSCGQCSSCIKFEKLAHPDPHFSFPYNKNDEVKSKQPVADEFAKHWRAAVLENTYLNLDDWHSKIEIDNKQSLINVHESQSIVKKLSLKPYESEFKFLIMWKAEMMNTDAANKLLKVIEEPSDKTLLILLAENEENLLQTITSRTQIWRIPPLTTKNISSYLSNKYEADQAQAERFAALAEGDLNYAQFQLQRKDEELKFFELFKTWMRACYKADIQAMHKWVEEVSQKSFGREGRKRFLTYAMTVMREGILRNYAGKSLQRFYGEEDQFMLKFAPFVHENNIVAISELLNEAHYHISRNAYPKIVFMDMSMKFANLLRVKKRTFVN
jgi:DNA polymerase-3 subunit delta'